MRRFRLPSGLISVVPRALACGSPTPTPVPTTGATPKLAPVSALSPEIGWLPAEVQKAYRFALANPDVLERIPCYCGCNRVGHTNNVMCYIQSVGADGEVVFDSHAAG